MATFLFLSLLFLFVSVLSTNDTTTTDEPFDDTSTTELYYTTTTDAPYTYNPTAEPTPSPSLNPVVSPTGYPTISLADNEEILLRVTFSILGSEITVTFVQENEALLIQLFIDSCNLNGEYVTVSIGKISDNANSQRRLLQSGVSIEFLVSIKEPTEYNLFLQQVDSGAFIEEFEEGLSDTYGDDVSLDSDSFIVENEGNGDSEVFFGKEDESFTELLTSPYILLGVVCTMIGIVWLLFLRTSITSKYPSYNKPLPSYAGNNNNDVIEMQQMAQQTSTDPLVSASSSKKKELNQKELEDAWNED